jgi:hypothetical protein
MKQLAVACALLFSQASYAQLISLDCRVQYQKDGELWHRAVALAYDKKKLITINIDGQPVYTFNALGTTIRTSMDSERIQIEFRSNQILWRSSLRDINFGSGVCIKTKS